MKDKKITEEMILSGISDRSLQVMIDWLSGWGKIRSKAFYRILDEKLKRAENEIAIDGGGRIL